ncbi:Hypothetical predicted protein [Cloeon dipterum]|uniref:Ig-like domain-containing protein n=1 Tax=Cloeon dipterum TaxID=197152 RepID=A0A8S1C1U3_9INSE|nr:Hypothetical predicted protein [Cloeon dipterum]
MLILLSVLLLLPPLSLSVDELQIVTNPPRQLTVMRGNSIGTQTTYIMQKRVGEVLNLTCRVVQPLTRYKILWHVPPIAQNRDHRVFRKEGHNSVELIVEKLHESDNGDYMCEATPFQMDHADEKLSVTVKINMKTGKPCGPGLFQCPNGDCIFQRYMCDGRDDCKSGADEHVSNCGEIPCANKIHCNDGRCIPFTWCCDIFLDTNCTVKEKPSCCQFLHHRRYEDEGMMKTTVYVVVGLSLLLLVVVITLAGCICKTHWKRQSVLSNRYQASESSSSATRTHQHHHHMQPLYDMCRELRNPPNEFQPPTGFLVTYNINNGVQFVGRPVSPPPYTEVMSSPPREGPPPPYISQENLVRNAQQGQQHSGLSDEAEVTTPLTSTPTD